MMNVRMRKGVPESIGGVRRERSGPPVKRV